MSTENYTQQDFVRGQPAALQQATKHPKILIVWPHGDEELGPLLGYHIVQHRPELLEHVDYLCGNPRAASQRPAKRYIDTDLNRSFNPADEPNGYEEKRAQEIMAQIRSAQYDYVLDLHTSTTDVGRFFLASQRNQAVDAIIAASPITRIVMMPESIAQASLIGQARDAISIEYNRHLAMSTGVEETLQLIDNLIAGQRAAEPVQREFFCVTRPILKTEDPGPSAKNFTLCADGYYPVLLGEIGYRDDPKSNYVGFAADSRETATL